MSHKRRLFICLLVIFSLLVYSVPVSAAQKWTAPTKNQWSVTKAPYGNKRSPITIQWNMYVAKYYPSAAFCVVPASLKKQNVYVQIYGKDANESAYKWIANRQIATWNATIDSSSKLPFQSGHTYQFKLRIAEKKNNAWHVLSGFSDVKSIKILYYPGTVTVKQTGAKTLRLDWSRVAGAQGYYVYIDTINAKSTERIIVKITSPSVCSYTFTNAVKGTHYCFTVSAYSGNLKSSDKSAYIRVQ